MQTIFTKPYILFLLVTLLLLPSFQGVTASTIAQRQEALAKISGKITARFDIKISTKQTDFVRCVDMVKQDPSYAHLQEVLTALYQDPVYLLYQKFTQSHACIIELEQYNKEIVHPELLKKITELLPLLDSDLFSSLRTTLKKQQVVLIDLFAEKDLILSVEKILIFQDKELTELIEKQKEKIRLLPLFKQAEAAQNTYLKSSSVQKLLTCIESIHTLLLQKQTAFLKNKDYQRILREIELSSGNDQPSYPSCSLKKQLFSIQTELFIRPLEDILL